MTSPLKLLSHARFELTRRLMKPQIGQTAGLDDAGLRLFTELLDGATALVEYGGGGSTLQAALAGKTVFSVESDDRFARQLQDRVSDQPAAHVAHGDIGRTGWWGVPLDQKPTPRNVDRWRAYVETPWRAAEAAGVQPDLVLVDGRFRVAAAAWSWLQMRLAGREGTILVDDYVGRPHYEALEAVLGLQAPTGCRVGVIAVKADRDPETVRQLFAAYLTDCR